MYRWFNNSWLLQIWSINSQQCDNNINLLCLSLLDSEIERYIYCHNIATRLRKVTKRERATSNSLYGMLHLCEELAVRKRSKRGIETKWYYVTYV